jgi:cob(I)alamin adenosyltransferase
MISTVIISVLGAGWLGGIGAILTGRVYVSGSPFDVLQKAYNDLFDLMKEIAIGARVEAKMYRAIEEATKHRQGKP